MSAALHPSAGCEAAFFTEPSSSVVRTIRSFSLYFDDDPAVGHEVEGAGRQPRRGVRDATFLPVSISVVPHTHA
ncbi:MAG: hypothetical protein IK000_06955 [Bacteroidaceae bacterium]|nr:hypothetical protein [Bacteroidaceae bacterium]